MDDVKEFQSPPPCGGEPYDNAYFRCSLFGFNPHPRAGVNHPMAGVKAPKPEVSIPTPVRG